MSGTHINTQTVKVIKTLWQHHIPPKTIATALDIKYATVSMYCRGFKATHKRLKPLDLVAKVLSPEVRPFHSSQDILNHHLASGE